MLGVLVAFLVCLLILRFPKQLWSNRPYPPGPLWLPIIGSMWRVGIKFRKDTVFKLAKQYGNVFMLWLGLMPMVVLSGYEAVKEGLINHSEDFADRIATPFLKIMGKEMGIIFSNGHAWKQQRKFALVTLRKMGLGKKGMEHQIEEEAHQLLQTFANAKGHPFDPSISIRNSVTNVICAVAFGYRFSVEDKQFLEWVEGGDYIFSFLGSFWQGFFEVFPWLMKRVPGPPKKALSYAEAMFSFARKEIEKHKGRDAVYEPQDFIDFYLLQMQQSKNDPNSTYNEDNLTQIIFEFFMAGSETATLTLRWALLLMANHPDIQEKVHKEIEDVLGSPQSFTYQDRKKLNYTNAVIHEIQRSQYVIFLGGPRQCTKDVNMLGFLIPKGTIIVSDLRSVLLDPKQWETPEAFNPNHFLDEDGSFVAKEAFLPFGAGARVCLGEQLARIELFIFFTSLMRAFTFQLPEGVKELDTDPLIGLSVVPRPYKICAVPRSSS
ncbi:cytochrome P450 2J5-like [Sphaerodactylus townsendi]|uniref:cytochrome P450 2J5-like n=1 Tax=Sphaerodactylus townsendi TaxID=933632 RepID=UPI0020271267|nr:cytochrome P450 2J5-like [Sphaerodactylus townsendi]